MKLDGSSASPPTEKHKHKHKPSRAAFDIPPGSHNRTIWRLNDLRGLLGVLAYFAIAALVVSACTTAGKVTGGVIGATVLGTRSVGSEIEQTYYIGVFDPQGQV